MRGADDAQQQLASEKVSSDPGSKRSIRLPVFSRAPFGDKKLTQPPRHS